MHALTLSALLLAAPVSNQQVGDKGTADPAGHCVPHNTLQGPSTSCEDDQIGTAGSQATRTIGKTQHSGGNSRWDTIKTPRCEPQSEKAKNTLDR